jgi:hypothetical protein
MTDFLAAADRLVAAYNDKDWGTLEPLIAPDLDFTHFNRDFAFDNRDGLFEVLRQFADSFVPDRRFEPPIRVTAAGNVVIREGFWSGTAQVDLPGFAEAGAAIHLKFCSVLRFDEDGVLVEWKDYG